MTKADIQHHMNAKHKDKILKEQMLKQELILANKLSKQRKQLWENISALKTKEYEERSKCNCKGYCNINHAKKHWFKSKVSKILISN